MCFLYCEFFWTSKSNSVRRETRRVVLALIVMSLVRWWLIFWVRVMSVLDSVLGLYMWDWMNCLGRRDENFEASWSGLGGG